MNSFLLQNQHQHSMAINFFRKQYKRLVLHQGIKVTWLCFKQLSSNATFILGLSIKSSLGLRILSDVAEGLILIFISSDKPIDLQNLNILINWQKY